MNTKPPLPPPAYSVGSWPSCDAPQCPGSSRQTSLRDALASGQALCGVCRRAVVVTIDGVARPHGAAA